MFASDDFDNLAENETCLINTIETTRSIVYSLKWCNLSNCNWCVSLELGERLLLIFTVGSYRPSGRNGVNSNNL